MVAADFGRHGEAIPGNWQVSVLRNGTLLFTLPFTINAPVSSVFEVPVKMTTGSVPVDAFGNLTCQTPNPQTVFSVRSYAAWVWFTFDGAKNTDLLTVKWFKPNGQDVPDSECMSPSDSRDQAAALGGLPIANWPAGSTPGNWKVGLYRNGSEVFTLPFTIQ